MTPPAVTAKTTIKPGSDPPQPRQFTFEEYCDYEDGTDNRYELVQGYLQLMTSPAGLHILICEFLVYAFNQLFQKTGIPAWAVREVGVRTGENTSRIVDVCVNQRDRWHQLSQPGEKGIFQQERTPLLVVEVTSTHEKEDYKEKYREYAAIGIPEYWIVNGRREHVRVCTASHPGAPYVYRDFVKGERIVSKVLPQLALTVDAVLNPPAVSQLVEQDQAQQAAAIDQARKQAAASEQRAVESEQRAAEEIEQARKQVAQSEQRAVESEQRAVESEQRAAEMAAMLARYQAQFGNLDSNASSNP